MKTVSIVGRPNVGKSTLFNQLIGEKKAITLRIPGITRDRIYGEVELESGKFNLIDTGGIVLDPEDPLEKKVMDQVKIAIEESDLILFLMDAKTGLHPVDEEIYRMLKKSGKRFIIVVNKIDSSKAKENLSDFAKFHNEEIFYISAEHKRETGKLLERIEELIKPETKHEERERFIIMGRPNVGKSSLLNAILNTNRLLVDSTPGTTRDPVEVWLEKMGRAISMIDTPGFRRPSRVKEFLEKLALIKAIKELEKSSVGLICIDAVEGLMRQDKRLISLLERKKKGIILVVNKIDLLDKKRVPVIIDSIKREITYASYIPVVPVSALKRINIEKLIREMMDVEREYRKKVDNKVMGRYLRDAIVRNPPPWRVQIRSIFQVNSSPPVFIIEGKNLEYMRKDYENYLEKSIRELYGFKGVPITFVKKGRRR